MPKQASILVVDDEAFILCMLSMRLRDHGYTVSVARNGREALRMILESAPALVITDFQMPLLNGLELAQALQDDKRTDAIPIIMLTARSHKLNVTELKATNVRHVLAKPFSAKEVVALADELLQHESPAAKPIPREKAA